MFRPFLVAESALQRAESTQQLGEIWLRRACRNATDAAVDSIAFVGAIYRTIDVSKVRVHAACPCEETRVLTYLKLQVRRQDSFFIEASCSILLYDSLRHPSKHPDNLIYINTALDCLQSMNNVEPVTNVTHSIQRILRAVESSISQQNRVPTSISPPVVDNPLVHANIKFPSLDDPSYSTTDLIFLSDRQDCPHRDPPSVAAQSSRAMEDPLAHTLSQPNCDILTTDLLSYFPLDMPMYQQPSDA